MKVIFFNPYADANIKGASRRVEFLTKLLDSQSVNNEAIYNEDYLKYNKSLLQKILIKIGLTRLAYFHFACTLTHDKNTVVISEVIFAPTWRYNFILTVHDLKVFNKDADRGGFLRKVSYLLFIKLANRIMVVSNFTKNDVVQNCNVFPGKILLVPNGVSDSRLMIAERFYNRDKIYDFVYVSSFAKHKRHLLLINSLPPGSKLALIGRDLGSLDDVKGAVVKKGSNILVDIFSNVDTDDQLFDLISSAYCGVFPSVFEGFGIPILEYASCGLFVIATDIPPFRELEEYVDIFVRPDSRDDLQKALELSMKQSYEKNQLRVDLVREGSHSEKGIRNALFHAIGLEKV